MQKCPSYLTKPITFSAFLDRIAHRKDWRNPKMKDLVASCEMNNDGSIQFAVCITVYVPKKVKEVEAKILLSIIPSPSHGSYFVNRFDVQGEGLLEGWSFMAFHNLELADVVVIKKPEFDPKRYWPIASAVDLGNLMDEFDKVAARLGHPKVFELGR